MGSYGEKKSKESYLSVFKFIFEIIAPNMKPKLVMADYEDAIRIAIKLVCPDDEVKFHGCHFHYNQVFTIFITKMINFVLFLKAQHKIIWYEESETLVVKH